MASAVIGLIGALLGAMVALMGSLVSARLQARQEHVRWLRDRRQAGYEAAVRYILRAANRRSHLALRGGRVTPMMSEDFVREWFDDLVEAQSSLRSLTAICGDHQVARLEDAADRLDEVVTDLNSGLKLIDEHAGPKEGVIQKLRGIVSVVAQCGREDLAAPPTMRSGRQAAWENDILAAKRPTL
jgi:hypothetical protein